VSFHLAQLTQTRWRQTKSVFT